MADNRITPSIEAFVFCQHVTQNPDRTVNIVRVTDELHIEAQPKRPIPEDREVRAPAYLTVYAKWSGGVGRFSHRLTITEPNGEGGVLHEGMNRPGFDGEFFY